jgi:hypothetical protein
VTSNSALWEGPVAFFLYLQVLDFVTTMVGFKHGLGEASPFIRWLLQAGPMYGVAASKLVAIALAAICLYTNRRYLVRWINYWYAALVVWNLGLIWIATPA